MRPEVRRTAPLWRRRQCVSQFRDDALILLTVRRAGRAPQKRTCATSAPADARRERGRSAHGRRDARIAAQGRQAATGGIPTEPDAAHGRMRRASLAARASGGGVTAARKRPRARANRGGERPRSRAPSAQRRGPRCDRTRTQSGDCGAVRAGSGTPSARGEARLGRSPPHADRHPTHGTTSQPQHRFHTRAHGSCAACENPLLASRILPSVTQ